MNFTEPAVHDAVNEIGPGANEVAETEKISRGVADQAPAIRLGSSLVSYSRAIK